MTQIFFTSSFYLFHCLFFLSSSFKNFKWDFPQLERPKVVEANNITRHPKVVEANNVTWHLKAIESINITMNVFYTFPFSSNLWLLIFQNIMIKRFFHLDLSSTLKIGKSWLPILLMSQGHVKISNLSMLLFPFRLSFSIYYDMCPPYRE